MSDGVAAVCATTVTVSLVSAQLTTATNWRSHSAYVQCS